MSTTLLLQLAFLTLILESSCQPLGDVSLKCPGNPALPSTGGYVTVYQPAVQQYVPVCQTGFNRAAAAAVCRQIGYVDAIPVFPGRSYFGDPSALKCSTEAYQNFTRRLSRALCSDVSNYTLNGELNIMRCSVGSVINTSCPLVAVECSNTQLQDSPGYTYNGQVYLHGASHEYYKGSLRVRLSNEYYSVCVDRFDTQAAVSICRQLGYSNGTYHAGERATADTAIDLTNLMCNANTGSFPCFTFCFNGDYSRNDQSCYEVFIECGFQIESSLSHSAGSWDQCKLPDMNTFDYKTAFIAVSAILGIVLLLIITVICGCIIYFRFCKKSKTSIDLPQ